MRRQNRDGKEKTIILTIHVDDGCAACDDEDMYKEFLDEMREDFDLSDSGKLEWFLGCKVEQDLVKGTVRISQEKYCNDVLLRFQMADANPLSTPFECGAHLTDDDCPAKGTGDPEAIRNYQQCVGALMYLACFTRPDCCFAVNQLARFMSNPGPSHFAAAKRVLRYLAGTRSKGITYKKGGQDSALASVGRRSNANELS